MACAKISARLRLSKRRFQGHAQTARSSRKNTQWTHAMTRAQPVVVSSRCPVPRELLVASRLRLNSPTLRSDGSSKARSHRSIPGKSARTSMACNTLQTFEMVIPELWSGSLLGLVEESARHDSFQRADILDIHDCRVLVGQEPRSVRIPLLMSDTKGCLQS